MKKTERRRNVVRAAGDLAVAVGIGIVAMALFLALTVEDFLARRRAGAGFEEGAA